MTTSAKPRVGRRAWTRWALAGLVLVVAVGWAFVWHIQTSTRAALAHSTLGGVWTIARAHESTHSGTFPDLATLEMELGARRAFPEFVEVPDERDLDSDGVCYVYVDPKRPLAEIDDPATEILLYEDPDHFRSFVIVVHVDGSITHLAKPEFRRLLDEQEHHRRARWIDESRQGTTAP